MKIKPEKPPIILLLLLAITVTYWVLYCIIPIDITNYSLSISEVKDLANIIFFIIIGAIGVLSYFQAQKTIFTPLKTETFKLQLKVFEEIFSYLDRYKKDSFI